MTSVGATPGGTAAATPLRIGVAGGITPAFLPLLAARDQGFGAEHGVSAELLPYRQPADLFAALERDVCELVVTDPLSLLAASARACEALGCFFSCAGGVLVREDRLAKLRGGEGFQVATPVPAALTDSLCRRILQGWAGSQGFALAETQIIIVEAAAAGPTDVLAAGWDAAWPALASDAALIGTRALRARLITAEDGGVPGFSALELVARKRRSAEDVARHEALIAAVEAATARLVAGPGAAAALWQAASGDASPDSAVVVAASLPCLRSPIDRRPDRWALLHAAFADA